MDKEIEISEARVYVGTYYKYNCGSLFGKWMKLSNYDNADDFYKECRRLHRDEEEPELMFQDYENIPEGLITECSISENFFPLRDAIEDLPIDEQTAFLIWCDNGHKDFASEDVDCLITSFKDDYVGKYDSEVAFAMERIADDVIELTDFAKQYFDYDAYAHDLFCTDFWYEDGYVFRNF